MGLGGRRSVVATVARRFLRGHRDEDDPVVHGFVSFIAAISVFGLSLGVTALLVVTSVMNGFEKELQKSLTAFHAHIMMFSRSEPLEHPDRYVEEIRKGFPAVTAVSPYLFGEVMLAGKGGVAGSVVEGIEGKTFGDVSKIPDRVAEGRLPVARAAGAPEDTPFEVALGIEVARKLRVGLGDSVMMTVPFLTGGKSVAARTKVVGLVKIGMYDYDSKYTLMELADFQKVLGVEGKVNAFKILTADGDKSLQITQALNDRYVYPLRARDWSSLNRNLFSAIKLEKAVIAVILMVIILVASFNVVSTILMMVHEKKRQVSMLKALGFRPAQTFRLFFLIGGGMAVAGAVLGLGIARLLVEILRRHSIIDLPADIYLFSRLPVEIRPLEWMMIAILSVLVALVATVGPSLRVSRRSPADGLREE